MTPTRLYGLSLLMALALPTAAMAERLDERLYLAPSATYSFVDSDRTPEPDDGMGYAVAIGKSLTQSLDAEIFFHAEDFDNADNSAGGTEISGYGANAYFFKDRDNSGRYMVIGLATNETETPTDEFGGTHWDIGFGYLLDIPRLGFVNKFLGKNTLLRADARYRNEKTHGDDSPYFQHVVLQLGLKIPIGRDVREEEKIAAALAAAEAAKQDADGDGVPDGRDKCPGTKSGTVVDSTGCAIDGDADGVVDSKDKCPNTPSGKPVDSSGCVIDGDGDGVLDAKDNCPKTPSGAKVLADGCALSGDCRRPLPGQKIDENGCAIVDGIVLRGVNFEFGRARLTANAKDILNNVADVLVASTVKFEIGGHTDALGDSNYNQWLSKQRANAVRDYLVTRGVESDRISTAGYGEDKPIADNNTEEGRELNRRVQIRILE